MHLNKLDDLMAMPLCTETYQQQLNDSMACGQSDDATIRAKVFATARALDDSMACRQSLQGPTTRGLRIGSRT